jgi:hypothetical protein
MNAISIPKPWAERIALGRQEVLNLPRKMNVTGPIFIHQHPGIDPKLRGRLPQQQYDAWAREQPGDDMIVARVVISRIVPIDECQMIGAHGPWCGIIEPDSLLIPAAEFTPADRHPHFDTWSLPEGLAEHLTASLETPTERSKRVYLEGFGGPGKSYIATHGTANE